MSELQRLTQQLAFVAEIDKLKQVQRRTLLLDRSRRENDAEHSWHLALMVLLLAEHANRPFDTLKVLKMVLIHDLVEIDAGDTYAFDKQGHLDKFEREKAAAERLFGTLPEDQAKEFLELWLEFETGESSEAQFASAIDRAQPLLHNCLTEGASWREHGVCYPQVVERCRSIEKGSAPLWDHLLELIERTAASGHLPRSAS